MSGNSPDADRAQTLLHDRTSPAVSVIIPAYNAERHILTALDSVLAQTMADLDVVVVDDGSHDRTAEVAAATADPRVRVLRTTNGGVACARNHGMAMSSGRYVAFLDADDVWLPTKLQHQVALLDSDPQVGLVLSDYAITGPTLSARKIVHVVDAGAFVRQWFLQEGEGPGFGSTAVVRRSSCSGLSFDPALSTSADLDFAWRLAGRSAVETIAEPLAAYRMHSAQMHTDFAVFERDMTHLYARVLGELDEAMATRAWANLHVRLFFYHLAARQFTAAAADLRHVCQLMPARIVGLPVTVARRRLRARVRRLRDGRVLRSANQELATLSMQERRRAAAG